MADVFISYKSERRPAARHLAETLTRHGYSVWYDYQLVKGRDFGLQIDAQIRASKAVIVLWCTRSVDSDWVLEEAYLAKSLGILVPAKIEACELKVGTRRADYVNLINWDGSPRSHTLDPLLVAIAQLVGREPVPQFNALRDYEANWRALGALPLSKLGIERPLEMSEGLRHLPSAPVSDATKSASSPTAESGKIYSQPNVSVSTEPMPSAVRGTTATPVRQVGEVRRYKVRVGTWIANRVVDMIPGQSIKDTPFAPEIVLVPPGKYLQGDESIPVDGVNRREVAIGYPLLVGKYPVTFDEWDEYAARARSDGFFGIGERWPYKPSDEGWGRDRRPVINVSWSDANDYATWLSKKTGKKYRLLSEAEWEYACRAGNEKPFSFGDTISTDQANYTGGGTTRGRVTDVGSFPPNAFGLHDMLGNINEWCKDAWGDNYKWSPNDGSARTGTTNQRVLRGGHRGQNGLRSASRFSLPLDHRSRDIGFRLARSLC